MTIKRAKELLLKNQEERDYVYYMNAAHDAELYAAQLGRCLVLFQGESTTDPRAAQEVVNLRARIAEQREQADSYWAKAAALITSFNKA